MPLMLEKETKEMNWKMPSGKETAQLLLEGDMIVPDSKPDLRRILRAEGTVRLKEKRISEDRISFSGELEICVLYRPKSAEKPLYAMKTTLPLEDYLHMEGLGKDTEVMLQGEPVHLDCRIINDRKIGVKAVIAVTAQAEEKKTAEILTGIDGTGVECLTGILRYRADTAEMRDRFSVKDERMIPAVQPEIGEILMEQVSLTDQDIRPLDGKVSVRGNLCIRLLYADGEGKVGSLTEKIPFSGYLENGQIGPKTELTGGLAVKDCRVTPAVDEDGEARRLEVDAEVEAVLKGRETEEQKILLDAYATEGAVELQKETISFPVTAGNGKNQFVIQERIFLEEGESPLLRAENVLGEIRLSEADAMTDAVQTEGVLEADILYHSSSDTEPVGMVRRGIPFVQTMEVKGVRPGDEVTVSPGLEEIDFQMLSETEGELRAVVSMDAAVQRQERAAVVTDAAVTDGEKKSPMPGAVIYMVQPGDSLWEIAKKYRTTAAEIAAVNEIGEAERLRQGQKLLILRMKG